MITLSTLTKNNLKKLLKPNRNKTIPISIHPTG
jgi:hypothetical protein